MSSGAFFVALIVAVGVVLAVFVTPILLIPAALIVLLALFSAPLLLWWNRISPGRGGGRLTPPVDSGEASYDPVQRPDGVTPRGSD